jgi:Tol biopolymer transport system component
MSPEKARGKALDKRTDIWAFGCVLYELLTGKQAFPGDTVTEILAAVLRGEPDWPALPAATPTTARALLRHCLQKDKTLRLRDAGDACIEIREALTAPSLGPTATVSAKRGWRQAVVLGLAVLVGAVVAGLTVWNLKPPAPPSPRPVSRFTITLPPGQQLPSLENGPAVALSPDGTHLAYVAIEGGTEQLFLRAMDSLETKPVPGTEGAYNPFVSPDGQWVGFFADGRLKKVSMSGGAAVAIGEAGLPRGAGWGSQGIIAFGSNGASIQQVRDAGGDPLPLTRPEKGDRGHRWPDFLPGGKAVLFATSSVNGNWTTSQVAVQSVTTGERRNLIQGGTHPRFAPSGHLVYAQGGNLMAVPFDLDRLAVTGAAVPVADGVQQSISSGAAQYSFSGTGSLVYVRGGGQSAQVRLVWVNRNGQEQPLAAPARGYQHPRLSPDGRRVAVGIVEQESQVWMWDLFRETLNRFTLEGKANGNPTWMAPDGKRISFYSNSEGPQNLFWQLADGSGGPERLIASEHTQSPMSSSLDGKLLAFLDVDPTTGWDIWVLRLGDRKAQPFLRTRFSESAPRFSPDGRWLAYFSNESGRFEVYMRPYPGPGRKEPISTEGGTEPVWNPNGRELFYRSGDKMMAVDIVTQPSFAAGKPHILFEGPYVPTPLTFPNYDVSPDGQRFLMLKPSESAQAAPTQINVVLNWFEELKQKAPAGKK